MNSQRTIKSLLSVSLPVILLSGSLRAGPGFRDDFSDGSVQDGSPVTWFWEDDGQGQRAVTGDGFSLRPNAGGCPWAWVLDEQGKGAVYAGTMTIRTQFKMDDYSFGAHAGIWFRAGSNGDYYLAGIVYNELYLSWSGNHQWHFFQQCQIPGYDAAQHDIIIQVDVTDFTDATGSRMSRLEVRGWMPGQDKPAQPQISVVDGKYGDGGIAIYAEQGPATFRWVEVITEPVPPTEPVVDFNGDGTVDMKDLLKLIEAWGRNEPAVDIVPDGVVDQKDLEVLMNHWQQDVNDPTLRAHWALDEAQGDLACDSTGRCDAALAGGPAWDPDGGQRDGALQLDGLDDCAVAPFVVNPADGPFSVFARVKGGAPGQMVLSQISGANWLMASTSDGALATELTSTRGGSLSSGTVVTDGNWHRVGFTWDGSSRRLYVDDVLVAEDTQADLAACYGGLQIGCGKNRAPGTFWSGLIDDVRIYNRAIRP